MKFVVIGFSKPRSKFAFFGSLIRWYYSTEYSHCYVKFTDVDLISQASKGMVNFMAVPVFEEDNIVCKEFSVPVGFDQFVKIKRYAMKTAGKKYSIIQVLGIVVSDILGLKKNPFDISSNTFVCSEYLGEILKILWIDLSKDLSLITPKDLYQFMEKNYDSNERDS